MPRAPLLVLLVLAPACDKPDTSPTTAPETASPTPSADPAPTTSTPDAAPEPATVVPTEGKLVGLELGDRACYVHLETGGAPVSIEGDFELCPGANNDASRLVGRTVIITAEKGNVLAASCEGDADCGKSDVVDVIVSLSGKVDTSSPVALDALDADQASARLGKPASKKTETWAADGGKYTTWTWPDKGIVLITSSDGAPHAVTCENTCTFATAEGIALGATADAVKKAYGKKINRKESSATDLIVGDAYGGTFFHLEGGKVVRIFVGDAAE
jgi:hypothetical protein